MATGLPNDELLIQKRDEVRQNYRIVTKGLGTPVNPSRADKSKCSASQSLSPEVPSRLSCPTVL